jgi:agmatinase
MNMPFNGYPWTIEDADDPNSIVGILDETEVLIIGAPFDETITHMRTGQREGPAAIRGASGYNFGMALFNSEAGAWIPDPNESDAVMDAGDADSKEELSDIIEFLVLNDVKPIILGGDHSVAYYGVSAAAKALGEPLKLVQIDAHHDCSEWQDWPPDAVCHATWVEWCWQQKHIDAVNVNGLRGTTYYDDPNDPGSEFSFFKLRDHVVNDPSRITDWPQDSPVWLTVDVDGFDPSITPGTGTPEPGGLTWDDWNEIAELVFSNHNVIGMDICEVLPAYDNPAGITSMLANRIAIRCIAEWAGDVFDPNKEEEDDE